MDDLMTEIARNAGDYAVGKWGLHLPPGQQKKLYNRFYDSVLSALMTFSEVDTSRKIRARAVVSEN